MARRNRTRVEPSLPALIVIAFVALAASLAAATPSRATPPTHASEHVSVIRLFGNDRFETSVAISRHRFPTGSSVAYLTRADQPTDALSLGNPTDGPLLLVPPCGAVPTTIRDEVRRLAPRRIIALGGESALCSATIADLATSATPDGQPTPVVERLAGASRVETSVAISRHRFPVAPVDEVNLISEATSIGALAAAPLSTGPLLVVRADGSVPDVTAAEMRRLRPGVVHSIDASNPVDVATSISRRHFPTAPSGLVVVLANRDSFADAITGGTLGIGPILFVPTCGTLDDITSSELTRLRPAGLVVLGGERAICSSLIDHVTHHLRSAFSLEDLIKRPAVHRVVGTDIVGVWLCRVPNNTTSNVYRQYGVDPRLERSSALDDITTWARLRSTAYYSVLSGGRYDITYRSRGVIDLEPSDGPNRCLDAALAAEPSGSSAVLAVDSSRYTGGLGSPGINPYVITSDIDTLSDDNHGRGMYIGGGGYLGDRAWLLRHEIGHMLHWPHSFADSHNEYDNPVDLMSGNHDMPLAFNVLAAGWLDLEHVHIHRSDASEVTIGPLTRPTTRLALVPHPQRSHDFISIEHRSNVFGSQSGVAVHMIRQPHTGCGFRAVSPCVSMERRQTPAVGRSGSTDHVLRAGQSLFVHGVRITVTASSHDNFTVRIEGSRHD